MNDYNTAVLNTLEMINILILSEIEEAKRVECLNTIEVLESIKLKVDCKILTQKIKYRIENTKEGDWFL